MIAVDAGAGILGTGSGLLRGLAARPLLVAALEDHVSQGALVVLCGEPGMGKDDALGIACVVGKQFGARTHTIDLEGLLPGVACERFARESRSFMRRLPPEAWGVVCARGIPPLDERCVYRMRGSIARLREQGICVVLALRPEAIQLAENCSDAYTVWAGELCMEPSGSMGSETIEELRQLSGGVPLLARALVPYEDDGEWRIRAGREYHDALCDAIALGLRSSLIGDERRIRLAAILLGSGTFSQLEDVIGELDLELVQDICRHAPLFGVDLAKATFRCAGLMRDEWFQACVFALREYCAKNVGLCARAAHLLLKEGRIRRAACVLDLCGTAEDAVAHTLGWCMELVNVGCADIVRRLSPHATRLCICSPQLRRACQTLMKLVDNEVLDAVDIELELPAECLGREREETLRISILLASRLAWQGRATKLAPEATALCDTLARDLLHHLSVTHALVEGRGHAAYHLLVCGSQLMGQETLVGQLLEQDLALAHVLMGLPCPGPSVAALKHDMGGACMLCYRPAITVLDAVWRQGDGVFGADNLAYHATQAGDELVLAHLLLAGAMANARCGAVSYAVVKCNRALEAARRLGAAYLVDASRIVCWAARINAKDLPTEQEFSDGEPMAPGMRALADILLAASSGAREPPVNMRDVTLDRDVAWLASALLTGLARLSPILEQVMPPTWLVIVESMRARDEDDFAYLAHIEEDEPDEREEHVIYVRLLGGLEVFVNGERLPIKLFERRRAKALITYVCSSASHSMRRADVIDALWPECDYEQGAKRIYAATNVVNRAVRTLDPDCRFFAARGTDHAIRLNDAGVRSDVAEFERLARQAIEYEGNDDVVLSLVRGVQGLYQGDLYVPPGEAGRAIDQRRVDLRELYTDVLVAGAEAAFRRGSLRLATRLCEQALLADETREDAIACLVRSLSSCGRTVEARDRSKAFTTRLGAIRRERANRDKG